MPEKTVLITGVGPGTGSSLARCFHKEGYKVAMIARNRERLDHLESELETFQYIFEGSKHKVTLDDNKISEIEKLIKERDIARKNGNYDQADEIRDKLTKMNVIIEDVNGKTEWKI